ncbi:MULTISPECIES: MerR family DNA-binding transcriptional regulator [unclassified Streptomyces]|uniref:MerR family transcriptional regulator n=1 Tax=unclassified Streptomyces TaxID=2593676 RepID=UPI00106EFBD2|nr:MULTISPECIES: MerR family DNA-binding transcriptional regulator [unclassified Streptomyces]MBH5129533.1 MerR family DNA-binding transcriptional regulator [Streptomyces sp. HB-N217]
MAWPIAEVARMSGVTARMLRHYDEIGLLPPARVGTNGRREIGRGLAEQVDEVEALRGHHRRLLAERDRLDALAGTVSRTIAELEQSRKDGRPMTINRPENLFEGVTAAQDPQSLRDFPEHAQAVARRVAGSPGRRVAGMSPQDIEAGQRERTARMVRLAELMAAGHRADAEPVQAEFDCQYRLLTALRTVTVDEYRAMGRSCVVNDAWRAAYEAIAPGLAAYQRDAIEVYATTRLN